MRRVLVFCALGALAFLWLRQVGVYDSPTGHHHHGPRAKSASADSTDQQGSAPSAEEMDARLKDAQCSLHVVDAKGRAIHDAQILAIPRKRSFDHDASRAIGKTNAGGRLNFAMPETRRIAVVREGFASAAAVLDRAGEHEVQLFPATKLRIRCHERGLGVAGVRVVISQLALPRRLPGFGDKIGLGTSAIHDVKTDAHGIASFEGLRPGGYAIRIADPTRIAMRMPRITAPSPKALEVELFRVWAAVVRNAHGRVLNVHPAPGPHGLVRIEDPAAIGAMRQRAALLEERFPDHFVRVFARKPDSDPGERLSLRVPSAATVAGFGPGKADVEFLPIAQARPTEIDVVVSPDDKLQRVHVRLLDESGRSCDDIRLHAVHKKTKKGFLFVTGRATRLPVGEFDWFSFEPFLRFATSKTFVVDESSVSIELSVKHTLTPCRIAIDDDFWENANIGFHRQGASASLMTFSPGLERRVIWLPRGQLEVVVYGWDNKHAKHSFAILDRDRLGQRAQVLELQP